MSGNGSGDWARLARRAHFSCGHRYYQPALSEEANREIFGSCYSEHGHGHNYILEAYLEGPIDPLTGMVINLMDVDAILKVVTGELDHRHLNFDVPAFKDEVPTTENVAKFCFRRIQEELEKGASPAKLTSVRLYENEDLWVDYGKL